jgi:hypothetical protein
VAFTPVSGTTTSASGLLQAVGISGTDHGSLDVRTTGLAPGAYTVTATTVSGSAPVTLGTFEAKAPHTSGTGVEEVVMRRMHTNAYFGGPKGIAFPDGFDPFDIAGLAISDSNANVLFTADLTTISDGAYDARTPIVSGTGESGAKGVVEIHAFAKGGVESGAVTIHASGLAASTTYTYAIDGTDIGTVTTGSGGSLRLAASTAGGSLPETVDLFTITTVTVHDASDNVILSASF